MSSSGRDLIAVRHGDTTYRMIVSEDGPKRLIVSGDTTGFEGISNDDGMSCPLNASNAATLRKRLPWLTPRPLGLNISAGLGDRLGLATPGHIDAIRGTGIAPVFAQQSVRENSRTHRTPQQVMDDAIWAVFECDWRDPWGADADHMKTVENIQPFIDAGYTFFTIDPGDHVDNSADLDSLSVLQDKFANLRWTELMTSPDDLKARYSQEVALDSISLHFDETTLLKAAVKYGNAIAHTFAMARNLHTQLGKDAFDLEVSVDETETTTTIAEHYFFANELKRLGVSWVSLAPRFVGRFEKGVDYIGDIAELDANVAGHAAIVRHFGNAYKLSLHSGSDKFSVYPLVMRHMRGLVHLKTAGTSYLEALRVMAMMEPAFFRQILDFSIDHYLTDSATYHVSAKLDAVPPSASLTDAQLPDLLNQFDARQVMHVTYGSVLDHFGNQLHSALRTHHNEYREALKIHFDKHLEAFK